MPNEMQSKQSLYLLLRNLCLNSKKTFGKLLSYACFAEHGTAIPEFVVQGFNIWLDISTYL